MIWDPEINHYSSGFSVKRNLLHYGSGLCVQVWTTEMPGRAHGGRKSWRMEMLLFINSQWGRPRGCPGEDVRGPHPGWALSRRCFPLTCSSQVRHQRQHLGGVVSAGPTSSSHPCPQFPIQWGDPRAKGYYYFFFNLLEFSWFTMLCPFFSIEQSDSIIHMCIFHLPSHDGLSQGIEYSSLCSTVRPIVYPFHIYEFASANPELPVHPSPTLLPLGKHKSVLYVYESVSVSVDLCHILDSTYK